MRQTSAIHAALKRLLKARGHTYADAAPVIGLSEASVKRLFAGGELSLQRLEALCDWLGVDIADVVGLAQAEQPLLTELTPAQERELLADPSLLLVAFLTLNHWREAEILQMLDTGRGNQQIASALGVTVNTVKWYLKNIYGKLGAGNRTEAVSIARRRGLLG